MGTIQGELTVHMEEGAWGLRVLGLSQMWLS